MSSADVAGRPSALGAWLALARVSNTPTVVSNTVAGAVLASVSADAGTVVVVAVAMALFYTAGMILNDVADEEVDRRERPERPIPSGAVSRAAALAAVAGLFAAGLAALAAVGLSPLLAGLGLVALIVLYDFWHKGNALSPVLMGGCRALVYVVAALAVAGSAEDVLAPAAVLLVYIVGLTAVAKAEATGSSPVWPVAAVLAPVVYWAFDPDALVLLAAFAAWAVWALWLVLGRHRIGPAVGRLIAGVALFDAVAVASAGGSLAAVAVCLAAFAATVALQTKIAGT
ncbi:MAG: UbiA family prenyltransferase [Solirubrobacteraceae bacterium]